MKILFFITLLANITFLFWEYNSASSKSSLAETGSIKKLNTIVLLSELADDKQKNNDAKHPIVASGLDSRKFNLRKTLKPSVNTNSKNFTVQKESTEIPRFDQLTEKEQGLIYDEIDKKPSDVLDSTQSLLEKPQIIINENQKTIVASVLDNGFGTGIERESNDTSLNKALNASKSSEVENNKIKKLDNKNQQQIASKDQVAESLVKTKEDSSSLNQADINAINNQKDTPEVSVSVDDSSAPVEEKNKLQTSDKNPQDNKKSTREFCYQIGPFSDSDKLNNWQELNKIPADSLQQFNKDIKVSTSYLVYYPAAETYEKSKQQVSLFKEKGITDYWLFRRGELKGVTSLGLFVRKDRAMLLQQKLQKSGLAAKVMPRHKTEKTIFAEVLTKDKDFKKNLQFSDQQLLSECQLDTPLSKKI